MNSLHTVACPACNKIIPTKAIPKHISGCSSWPTVIGIPPSEFNWDAHCKRGPYADGLTEGVDYIKCLECHPKDIRFKRMMDHLTKVHGLTEAEYTGRHPGAPVRVAGTALKREATVQARYGVDNVFQAAEVKATSRETMFAHYGAHNPLQSPTLRAKITETVRARYGVGNVFASPEVQEKIRQTNLTTYGVENAGRSPVVVARRIETNMLRYGSPVPQGFGILWKTKPEKLVEAMAPPNVRFTGDRSYWVRCKGSDGFPKNRNPDFVVYDPERLALVNAGAPLNEVRTNRVIEVLGDYWHREELVGLPRDAYVASRKAEYADIGIACLVLWESEVKTDPEGVRARLTEFCRA